MIKIGLIILSHIICIVCEFAANTHFTSAVTHIILSDFSHNLLIYITVSEISMEHMVTLNKPREFTHTIHRIKARKKGKFN